MEGMSLYRFSPHCVCIFSPLFSFDSNFSSFIFIFIILQLPLTQGSCLFTMYVRQSSGEGTALVRLECTGWNGTKKGTLFYLMTMVYGCIAIRQKRTTTPPKALGVNCYTRDMARL